MPLGLLSIASNLPQKNTKVEIYKPHIQILNERDYQKVAHDIIKRSPWLIGFSTWCISYPSSLLIAKEIKKLAPELPVLFGGPQASLLAAETLTQFPYVDYVLSGEADFTFPQLVHELKKPKRDLSSIPGLFFKNGTLKVNQSRKKGLVSDLDLLPIPKYNLVPRLKWMKLDVGRGCPFSCTYCSTNQFFAKNYRTKSTDRIIHEIELAYQTQNIRSFSFAHDLFTFNKEFVFDLCDKLISLQKEWGKTIQWNCSARIDCISKEMLIQMKSAGCSSIFFGIETGSQRMQKIIKKNLNVSKAAAIADVCRKIGIKMHASLIIGFPEETKAELNETLRCAFHLFLKGAFVQASELTLLPGTSIYEKHKSELRFDGKFSNFSRNVSNDLELQLIKKYPFLFSSFYFLPVKAIDREQMIYLRLAINNSKHFRETLFLLSDIIEDKLENSDLLQWFRKEFQQVSNSQEKNIPLHWIQVIDKFLINHEIEKKNRYLPDVFTYESYSALLKLIFTNWQVLNFPNKKFPKTTEFMIKPTPIWKVIETRYLLEKILPSLNSWEFNKNKCRKGNYYYLLVAESEISCKRIKINAKDYFLFNQLSELSFKDFVKKVEHISSEMEVFEWLKKMHRIGVIKTEQYT